MQVSRRIDLWNSLSALIRRGIYLSITLFAYVTFSLSIHAVIMHSDIFAVFVLSWLSPLDASHMLTAEEPGSPAEGCVFQGCRWGCEE